MSLPEAALLGGRLQVKCWVLTEWMRTERKVPPTGHSVGSTPTTHCLHNTSCTLPLPSSVPPCLWQPASSVPVLWYLLLQRRLSPSPHLRNTTAVSQAMGILCSLHVSLNMFCPLSPWAYGNLAGKEGFSFSVLFYAHVPCFLISDEWLIYICWMSEMNTPPVPMQSTFLSENNIQFSSDCIKILKMGCFPVFWRHSQITHYEQGKQRKVTRRVIKVTMHTMSNLIKDKPWKDKEKSPGLSPK